MGLKTFFISIFGQDLLKRNAELLSNLNLIALEKQSLEGSYKTLLDKNSALQQELDALNKPTALDLYCQSHFKPIEMPAYRQKRHIKGKYYSIALNELITPDSFEVKKFFKGLVQGKSLWADVKMIGAKTARYLKWTDDKNLDTSGDYYLYPNESIALVNTDCEDHSFVNASAHPEIGIAWGIFNRTTGHAFNVFIDEGKLYILETTGDMAEVFEYTPKCGYDIYFIITREKAYEVKKGISFGEAAGW